VHTVKKVHSLPRTHIIRHAFSTGANTMAGYSDPTFARCERGHVRHVTLGHITSQHHEHLLRARFGRSRSSSDLGTRWGRFVIWRRVRTGPLKSGSTVSRSRLSTTSWPGNQARSGDPIAEVLSGLPGPNPAGSAIRAVGPVPGDWWNNCTVVSCINSKFSLWPETSTFGKTAEGWTR
jgi:hypothetical protein